MTDYENEKFIEYQNLSKKERRKIDAIKRKSWGEIKPITRVSKLINKYNRKLKNYDEDDLQ